jgi:hypothetical protein
VEDLARSSASADMRRICRTRAISPSRSGMLSVVLGASAAAGLAGSAGALRPSSGGSPANRSQPARGLDRASQRASPRPALARSSRPTSSPPLERMISSDRPGSSSQSRGWLSPRGAGCLVAVDGHRSPPSPARHLIGGRFAASAKENLTGEEHHPHHNRSTASAGLRLIRETRSS